MDRIQRETGVSHKPGKPSHHYGVRALNAERLHQLVEALAVGSSACPPRISQLADDVPTLRPCPAPKILGLGFQAMAVLSLES